MIMENEILADKILDEILDGMDNKTKNMLIKLLMMHDKKDIFINQTPIYGDLRHNGNLVARYIKEYKYAIGVKHEAAAYVDAFKGDEPHIINVPQDDDYDTETIRNMLKILERSEE